jgi:proteic killer suppression protein
MIKSFKHKGLERFYLHNSTAGIQSRHALKLLTILARLDIAYEVEDMALPGLRLYRLKGVRQDTWSVWVSGNWRVTFCFHEHHAIDVNYEDYH